MVFLPVVNTINTANTLRGNTFFPLRWKMGVRVVECRKCGVRKLIKENNNNKKMRRNLDDFHISRKIVV